MLTYARAYHLRYAVLARRPLRLVYLLYLLYVYTRTNVLALLVQVLAQRRLRLTYLLYWYKHSINLIALLVQVLAQRDTGR